MQNFIGLFFSSAILITSFSVNLLFGVEWIGPINVFATQYAQNPLVGVDAEGNAVIFANASDDLATYYQEGAQLVQGVVRNLKKYQPLDTDTITEGNTIALAVNSEGNAAVIFKEINDSSDEFMRAALLTNDVWGDPSTISVPFINNFYSGLTLDNSSHAIAVWNSSNLSIENDYVQESQYVAPNWSTVDDIATYSSNAFSSLAISGSPSGKAMAIWTLYLTNETLFGGYYHEGVWKVVTISENVYDSCQPPTAISMNTHGQAMIIWEDTNNSILTSLFYSESVFGSKRVVYAPSDGEYIVQTSVAFNDQAHAIALWTLSTNATESYKVLASRFSNNKWSTPTVLDTVTIASNDILINPIVGIDQYGNAYAVWEKDDGSGNGTIYYSRYAAATDIWSNSPTRLSTEGTPSSQPNLSMNGSGGATVVWSAGTTGNQTIQAVYTKNLPPPIVTPNPPENLNGKQVKNRFLTQTDSINEFQWTASTTKTVVSYKILRDGVQIATMPASGPLAYQDHNRQKNTRYLYEVIAIDKNGLQSKPVTLVLP